MFILSIRDKYDSQIEVYKRRIAQLDSGRHNQLQGAIAVTEQRARLCDWIAELEAAKYELVTAPLDRMAASSTRH